MYGKGILKGLRVTWDRFWATYTEDIAWLMRGKKRYFNEDGVRARAGKDTRGIFTVQYPEEKLITPEEFRYVPFLVYDEAADGKKEVRCTSCGICAKVCPPQCIWIVRTNDPATGRPVPVPADFYIDADICMNCGLCAEYCPFNAIIMDHDYQLANYERHVSHIYDVKMLLKSTTYYAKIHPTDWTREQQESKAKEAAKAKKQAVAS